MFAVAEPAGEVPMPPDAVQRDERAISELASKVLTLPDCEKLAREHFCFRNPEIKNITQDPVHATIEQKNIQLLCKWKQKEGNDATAQNLARHLCAIGLEIEDLRLGLEILEIDSVGKYICTVFTDLSPKRFWMLH